MATTPSPKERVFDIGNHDERARNTIVRLILNLHENRLILALNECI